MNPELITSLPIAKLTRPVPKRDHIQGPIDAPIVLLEYGETSNVQSAAKFTRSSKRFEIVWAMIHASPIVID